jgi:hypothetical protein
VEAGEGGLRLSIRVFCILIGGESKYITLSDDNPFTLARQAPRVALADVLVLRLSRSFDHNLTSIQGVTGAVLNASSKGYMRKLKRLGRKVFVPALVLAWITVSVTLNGRAPKDSG